MRTRSKGKRPKTPDPPASDRKRHCISVNPHTAPVPESSTVRASSFEPASEDTWREQKSKAETRLDQYELAGRSDENFLVETLNAALIWLPQGGRDRLAEDILREEANDRVIWEIFSNLRSAVLEAVRSTGKTVAVTPSPDRDRQRRIGKVAEKLPESQDRSADFVNNCLARDGSRCVITGAISEEQWKEEGKVEGVLWGDLEVHHIIPLSLGYVEGKDDHDIAIKWASIYNAFPQLAESIRVSKINAIKNGITLWKDIHVEFQKFELALAPTDTEHVYSLKKYKYCHCLMWRLLDEDSPITLRQAAGQEGKPLPLRDFLDTHYRLAEIYHAAGFADQAFSNAMRWEEIKEEARGHSLREDGSTNLSDILFTAFATARVLQHA